MRKSFYRNLSVLVSCLAISTAWAQDSTDSWYDEYEESHSSYVGFTIMQVTPSASLSSAKELFGPSLLQGGGFKFEGAWMFHKNIGIGGSVVYQKLNKTASLAPNLFKNWLQFHTDGQWNNAMVTGGIFLSKPFLNFAIDARLLGGYGYTWAYKKRMYYNGPGADFERTIDYSGGSLWWNPGMGFRMDFGQGWSFGAGYDYLFTTHDVSYTDFTGPNPAIETHSRTTQFYGFHCINLTLYHNFRHFKKVK